ncbi:MAG: hypothetical protein ACK559_33910, partial [bacterium]
RLHGLRLARHEVIVVVPDLPAPDEGLEVGPELHAVGRVHEDHLNLSAEVLEPQQRVHDHERVAEHEPIDPLVPVLVSSKYLLRHRPLFRAEEVCEEARLLVPLVLLQRVENRAGGQPLMDEQRQRRHVERQPLRLARPVEERARHRLQLPGRVAGFLQRRGLLDRRQ